jgi:cytochrome P450
MYFLLCLFPIFTILYLGKAKRFISSFTNDHSPKIQCLPKKDFFIGDWKSICNNIENANDYHTANIKKYGTHQFSLPFSPIYINLEPNEENLKHILLKNFTNYIKDDEQKLIFGELFGNGIFATDNIQWKNSRLLMSKFLLKTQPQLNKLFHDQVDNIVFPNDNLVEKFINYNELINNINNVANNDVINDVINNNVSNDDVNDLNLVNDDLNDINLVNNDVNDVANNDINDVANNDINDVANNDINDVANDIENDELLKNNEQIDIQKLFFELTAKSSFQMIFGENVNMYIALNCAEMFDKCQELMFKRYFKPWWRIEKYFNIGDEKIIKVYIKILDEYCSDHFKNPDGLVKYCIENGLNETDTRDVVMNMLIASRDTTATALTWCMYEIIKNPNLIDKLRTNEEFLMNFINETLRLHPPIPSDSKMVVNDDILPDGTHLPAKSIIIYRAYAHGRLLYQDGTKFNSDGIHNKSAYYNPIFNAGPRICLGKYIALLQIKIVLSTLIKKYNFKGNIYENPTWIPGITLRMKHGLYVSVNKRSV